jgi:crotonobetainyl-CoA:carnitine CoA-transferase CaiB-like acyl-CoA transferase
MVSGPLAAMMLADQGCEVIKIENANEVGDKFRGAKNGLQGTAAFSYVNRNKRSVTLNTKDKRGRQALLDIAKKADVFLQNFRPGVADRMGIGYDAIKSVNPDIIYVSISGFGEDGPYSEQMVYDFVIQALCGVADTQRKTAGAQPELSKNIVIDKVTSYTVCQAVTAALFARLRGKGGQHVKVSMLDTGLAFMGVEYGANAVLDSKIKEQLPPDNIGGDAYNTRATKDGWVVLNIQTK